MTLFGRLTPATPDVFTNTYYTSIPPGVFGSDEFSTFCLEVPLSHEFPVAKWHGQVIHQKEKFEILMRHGVPLIWRQGFKNCIGLKVDMANADFLSMCCELLQKDNMQTPSQESINVKSAKIGQVRFKI